jgi:hypothetical protein
MDTVWIQDPTQKGTSAAHARRFNVQQTYTLKALGTLKA